MATGAQQVQTFQLILKAQDEATAAIQSVGTQLDKLGANTSLAKLSELISEQTVAMGEALAKQTEMLKEALAEQEVAEKEHEGVLSGLREKMERPIEFAKVFIGFEAGMAALSALTEGIHELPRAFMEAADEGDRFAAQMANFYGGLEQGRQVMEYTNQTALKLPFSLAQIRQATASLSEAGQNVPAALPALGNIAAAYHTNLTDVIDVANRAIATGATRGLESYLHMTKAQLGAAGVEWDKQGHLIASSVLPALETIGNTRFGNAMAAQAETAQGGLVRIANAFDLFKESAGEGLMKGLGGPLRTLTDWISTHQSTIVRWGEAVGATMAKVGAAAMGLAAHLGPPIGAAIALLVAAWNAAEPAIETAIGLITTAMGQIGTFLHERVLPVVEQALGQIVTWWNQNKDQIVAILNLILGAWNTFAGSLQQDLSNDLNILHGEWDIGWNLISGSFSAILDVMTGNWKKFGDDLNNMATGIAVGILEIFKGLVDKTIDVVSHLADPINAIMHAEYDASRFLAGAVFDMWNNLPTLILQSFDALLAALPKIEQRFVHWLLDLGKHAADALRGINPFAAHRGAGGGGSSGFGTTDDLASAAAADARTARQKFLDQFSFGWAPQTNLVFQNTSQQAQATFNAQVDAWIKQIEQSRNIFTGAPSTYGTQSSQQAAGQTFLEQLNAWLKKHQITLPALPTGGGVTGVPDLAVPGGTGAAAPGGTTAKDLVQAAKDAFDLLLEKGPVTWATGMKDIARIALAEHAAKTPDSQVVLDVLRDTKQLVDKLLGQAQKQFDFDAHVAHPSLQRLHQDEANYLAILAKTPGITPLDIRTARQSMDQQISALFNKAATSGQVPAVPSPAYGTYGGLATGYGQTTVSFGGTQQSGWAAVVAELRAQLAFWRSRALAEQRQLDAQQQTAQNTAQIARNTQSAADKMDQPGRGSASVPAATAVRGVGGFQVMRRV